MVKLSQLQGPKGDRGERGLMGPTGAKGEKGDRGDRGLQGIQGIMGLTGAKGEKGDPGRDGKDGKDGKDGFNGAKGDKGDKGDAGLTLAEVTSVVQEQLKGDDFNPYKIGSKFVSEGNIADGRVLAYSKDSDKLEYIDIQQTVNAVYKTFDFAPVNTKGDLYTYSNGRDRLPVGNDGYVLTADSSTATGLKWAVGGGGGSSVWGGITGTLSNQTDLQTALNGKANTSHTHALSDLTQSSATTGQVPTWDGSAWTPATPTGTNTIPQYTTDPASPTANTAWVLKTSGVGGTLQAIFGLGFPLLTASGTTTYKLSYRTSEGTTVRVTLS